MYSEEFSFRKLPQVIFSKSCGKRSRGHLRLMWNGLDEPPPGHNEGGRDGGDSSITENINAGPCVETMSMTTAVAKINVADRGFPKLPFSLSRIMQPARGPESQSPFVHPSLHSLERHSCSGGDQFRPRGDHADRHANSLQV